jgi:hypothetical protein
MADMLAIDDGDPDAGGKRVMSFRQQASLHHEGATFITDARGMFREIERFISGLDADARGEADQVAGGIDPKSKHYLGDWLADNRNVTFHYPEMHPEKAAHGKEEIREALRKAASLEGTITASGDFGTLRFGFADDVPVQWLPDTETQVHRIEELRESVMALARFAQPAHCSTSQRLKELLGQRARQCGRPRISQ